ncbi:MAG: LruC domain-containing protein, partial [Duncaniella sp.]|nr:LruC domain-containing protein [Duncaniella sp.]
NQAQKSSVTVKTSRPSSIKLMADIKGKRYLFADYREASGSNEIPLTLPKSVTDIIVKVNGQNFPAKLGATVDASSASRTVWETENEPIKVRLTENRLFRTPEQVLRYREYLPEEIYNIGKVTQDFLFESKGPFLIYPAYYQTSRYNSNILGIYYYNEVNGEKKLVTQDFFQLGNGKTMMFSSDKEGKTSSQTLYWYQASQFDVPSGADSYDKYTNDDWEFIREKIRIGEIWFDSGNFKLFSEFNHKVVEESGSYNAIITGTYKEYEVVYGKGGNTSIPDEAETLAFQAIEVDIPEGQLFGMYLKIDEKLGDPSWGIDPNHTIFFSESHLNTDYLWAPKSGFEDEVTKKSEANTNNSEYLGKDSEKPTPACHAAAFTRPEDGMIRLCFEDWYNTTGFDSDFDLNDMVFYIDGLLDTPPPTIVEDDPDPEPEPYQWIIAAEDLGGSYDWDFNDVVAGVSIQAMKEGEKEFSKVTVTPLASGGTLPVYFMYTGEIINHETGETIAKGDYVIGGEFHSLFGSNFGTYINASKGKHIKADPITFYTPAGHSLASSGHVHYDGKNMGGFWVLAAEMNSPLDLNPANNYGLISINPGTTNGFNKISNSKPIASEDLTAPQIICVEAEWEWPLEETNIKKAYPEFETWVGDESHRTWINNKDGELTVDR